MLYALAHIIRDEMPWLWDLVDRLNSWLFVLRYGKKLRDLEKEIVNVEHSQNINAKDKVDTKGFKVVPIRDIPTDMLVAFFAHQPEEAFRFFHPHGFDAKSIKKLQRNKAFLGFVLVELRDDSLELRDGRIAGYCFNRSFFHGKGFRGRMVGIDYRGMGLGTMMNKLLNEVGFGIGLRLFETVSRNNLASYRSTLSASEVKILEEMPDNDLYLEIIKH